MKSLNLTPKMPIAPRGAATRRRWPKQMPPPLSQGAKHLWPCGEKVSPEHYLVRGPVGERDADASARGVFDDLFGLAVEVVVQQAATRERG